MCIDRNEAIESLTHNVSDDKQPTLGQSFKHSQQDVAQRHRLRRQNIFAAPPFNTRPPVLASGTGYFAAQAASQQCLKDERAHFAGIALVINLGILQRATRLE